MVSRLLPRAALLAFGLSILMALPAAGQVMNGDDARPVLAVREAMLKAGADAQEFERHFADVVSRWWREHIPGVTAYLARGERGARTNMYLVIYEFDSLDRRNEYFPQPDVQSERFVQLAGEAPDFGLDEYIEPVAEYTDYVVLRQ